MKSFGADTFNINNKKQISTTIWKVFEKITINFRNY